MFKSARWRSEKNKIKAVFKLQFQATQVPQFGWDTLMISLVPVEVGKSTVRSEKVAVKDGSCRWENPIYETVKFFREPKTGKFNEKIYQFLVSTGTSKAGLLGEVTIDFTDYVEAIKPSSVSLPLKTSKSGAVLHVTIQKMQGDVDQREEEENGNGVVKSQDRSLKSQLSNCDTDGSSNCNSTEDGSFSKTTSQNAESNGNLRSSSSSDATSASGSESSSGLNTPRELGLKNNNIHQDPTIFLSSLSHSSIPRKPTANDITTSYQEHQRLNTEWSKGSASDGSMDDLTNSSEDTVLKERSSQASDISVEKLRSDFVILARQAEVSELELQTLRKQILKESKRGQELSRQVLVLKEERDALKRECELLKASQKHITEAKAPSMLLFESDDPRTLLEEIRQELNYEKDLNANLRLQLQKTQESNSELILAVQDLDEMLEQKNKEIPYLSNKSATNENVEEIHETGSKHEMVEDEEQQALEELIKEHNDAKEAYLLEQKVIDLYSELEVYRRDRDELEMQLEQLALDYEILKQENHDMSSKLEQNELQEQLEMQYDCSAYLAAINELENQVESLEKELEKQSQELSASSAAINVLETQVDSLEKELEKQEQSFEADLETVTHARVEQEQRAIRAEEALRKTRWNNAKTAEQLQEEFRRLSLQMASTFESNEKLAMKALTEASELRLQKNRLEEMLEKANEELGLIKDRYEAELLELSNQIDLKTKQTEQLMLKLEDMSKDLEHQKKQGEEMHEAFSKDILMLKAEIERLMREKNYLSEQAGQQEILKAEMELMKTSIDETEMLVLRGNVERDELEREISLITKEAEKLMEELNNMRLLKEEKETMIGILQSEVEALRAQYNDFKHSLFEDELEKENLRKQIFHLKGDLRKKEDTITIIEKKLKNSSGRVTGSDLIKLTSKNKSAQVPSGSKEVANLREKIKLLEGQIKLKEAALENSANSFLEKEKDLHKRIEEMENRMEELSQNDSSFCEDHSHKETIVAKNIIANGIKSEGRNIAENLLDLEMSTKAYMSVQEGIDLAPIKSSNETCSKKEPKVCTSNTSNHGNLAELLNNTELLKERNKSMESELKEMQERYSEISLKFAEVEGERQQLVMTVRNLKNAKK